MLGNKIGEASGTVSARRVLPSSGGGPSIETSFTSTGKLLGVDIREVATYSSTMRQNGTLLGSGQGIIMGRGGETATWVGQGVGTVGADGTVSFRGAVYYETASPAWTSLNGIAAVFEYSADAEGKTKAELWEWK
jgi:hypothetical protein